LEEQGTAHQKPASGLAFPHPAQNFVDHLGGAPQKRGTAIIAAHRMALKVPLTRIPLAHSAGNSVNVRLH